MAKRASGDKSAAWLPGVCGQTQHGQTHDSRTRMGPALRGHPWGAVGRLAEKVTGRRRKDRAPWGGQRRKGTFTRGFRKVASPFPKEAAATEDSLGHCPQGCSQDQSFRIYKHFPIVATLNPHCNSVRYLLLQIWKLRLGVYGLAKVTWQSQNVNRGVMTPGLGPRHGRVWLGLL